MVLASLTNNVISKIKTYFSNMNWRNTLLFLLFLVLAAVFWMMLFFQRDIEATYKIPVKYTNIPDDVVFDHTLPKEIEIRVGDKGSEIFRYAFKRRDSIDIDVQKYHNERINNLQGTELMQLIRQKLFKSSTLSAYYPANISLSVSKLQQKKLSVLFDGEITTGRNNLVAEEYVIDPLSVTAYGSDAQLSELENAATEFTQFNNLKATSQFQIKIKPVEGVKFVPDAVEIYIPILEYTERKFEIPIAVRNVPNGIDVKFFPSYTEVSFSVTLDDYRKISQEDFKVELDYRSFHNNEDGRVELELTSQPESVRNSRLSTISVEFLLEKEN